MSRNVAQARPDWTPAPQYEEEEWDALGPRSQNQVNDLDSRRLLQERIEDSSGGPSSPNVPAGYILGQYSDYPSSRSSQDSQTSDPALDEPMQNLSLGGNHYISQIPGQFPPIPQQLNNLNVLTTHDPRSQVQTAYATASTAPYNTREQITEQGLLREGKLATRLLLGTPGNQERLYPEYHMRPSKFFKVGRVFFTLWAEPVGGSTVTAWEDASSIPGAFRGERVYSKVRRFVVIREGNQYCSALPIVTYNNQGVGKPGVTKREHAIIYTGRTAPSPMPSEYPARHERPMLSEAIRVQPDVATEQLDTTSRIDFGKVHTIQHNLKVKPLGQVHRRSERALAGHFSIVWDSLRSQAVPRTTRIHGDDNNQDQDDQHHGHDEEVNDSGVAAHIAQSQRYDREHGIENEDGSATPRAQDDPLQRVIDDISAYIRAGRSQDQAVAAYAEHMHHTYGHDFGTVVARAEEILALYHARSQPAPASEPSRSQRTSQSSRHRHT